MRSFLSLIISSVLCPVAVWASDVPLNGIQCVARNDAALHLTDWQLWRGEGLPPFREAPDATAKEVGAASSIIYVTWPIRHENGFVQVVRHDGKLAWLDQTMIRTLKKADGTPGGCTVYRGTDGRLMQKLDPGVAIWR